MKCIIIFQIWNKMLIQYENIKCDRDMDLYMYVCMCMYIYCVLKHHRTSLVL